MRVVVELIIVAAIIALGWEQPLKERVPWFGDKTTKNVGHARAPALAPRPLPTATVGSWMWDPNHKSPLDPARKGPTHRKELFVDTFELLIDHLARKPIDRYM